MALIRCSECGQTVSDRATTCPRCGNPINAAPTPQGGMQQPNEGNNNNWLYWLIGALAVIGIVVAFLVGSSTSSHNMATSASAEASTTDSTASSQKMDSTAQNTTHDIDAVKSKEETSQAAQEPQIDALAQRHLHLTGTIAGQNVVMDLDNNDGILNGSYYYTRYGDKGVLRLKGSIDERGHYYIDHYNTEKGYMTAVLEGNLTRSGNMTGEFRGERGNFSIKLKVR